LIMGAWNRISENRHFRETSLYRSFRETPLHFIDVGAAGGIHDLVQGAASIIDCVCFEPEKEAARALRLQYAAESPFASMTILETALSGCAGQRTLHITKSAVNTSLLAPEEELTKRYRLAGFQVEKTATIATESLDGLRLREGGGGRFGEFIKLDCQGAEYEILRGAEKILQENCIAIMCEVEFFPLYKNQQCFSELDLFLRANNFQLYGLYPHYISARSLNRRDGETEERLLWADALYFKDPLHNRGAGVNLDQRGVNALLVVALLTRYYDLALELSRAFFREEDIAHLELLIQELSGADKREMERDVSGFIADCQRNPDLLYLLAKKFIDGHRSNSNIDFIEVKKV